MTSVFISYRRDDHQGFAGRLRDDLQHRLGDSVRIDRDVDGALRPGEPFPDEIRQRVADADVVLAVIGPRWLDILDARTQLPGDDWVRIELELAQSLGKPIIPVLLETVRTPKAEALPETLAFLAKLGAMRLRDMSFRADAAAVAGEVRMRLAARPAEGPRWMWWSTRDSFNNDVPSVTAIIETMLAVVLYWWIAITFETYWPLIIGAATAPFVLLRSDESVKFGQAHLRSLAWRIAPNRFDGLTLGWYAGIAACSLLIVGTSFGVIAEILGPQQFRLDIDSWPDGNLARGVLVPFWLTTILTGVTIVSIALFGGARSALVLAFISLSVLVFAGALLALFGAVMFGLDILLIPVELLSVVLGENEILFISFLHCVVSLGVLVWLSRVSSFFSSLVSFYFTATMLGPVLIAVNFGLSVLRAWAVIRNFFDGVRNLSKNFRRLVLCSSPLQIPEVFPGAAQVGAFDFMFWVKIVQENWVKTSQGNDDEPRSKVAVSYAVIVFWFLPVWIYRLTIKSTAWLWWPLAFIGAPAKAAARPDLYRRLEIATLWGQLTVVLAVALVGAFFTVQQVPDLAHALPEVPRALVTVMLLPAHDQGIPWQWLGPVFGVLSVLVVLWLDRAHARYDEARKAFDRRAIGAAKFEIGVIEIVGRIRALMVLGFILLVGGYATLTLNARAAPVCWFAPTAAVQSWGLWAYGSRMPSPPACDNTAWSRFAAWRAK